MTEKQLEAAYEKILSRIDKVNADYLQKVAEQIKAIGRLNPSSIDRLAQMRVYGANVRKLKQDLAKALGVSTQEVHRLLERAAVEEYTTLDFTAVVKGVEPLTLANSPVIRQYVRAVQRQTAETLLNYSNTTNIDTTYQEAVSDAIDAVSRGVTDYNSAIRSTMRKLGGDGLRVTYESGVTRRMDTAIRQNVLDGVRQISQRVKEDVAERMGTDGWELSAHPYSAIDHEPAQGRMYTNEEFANMQSGAPFVDVDGNSYSGFPRPIGQWNCHHMASPVILGISKRRYTDEQLEQWRRANHKGCEIDGKQYTIYQASQLMRKLETKVRQQKDIANMAKISGDDTLRREAQAKIRDLKKKYEEVANAAGLKERRDRMVVEAYKP